MLAKYIRYLIKHYLFALLALLFTLMYWVSAAKLPQTSVSFPRALTMLLVPLFIWNAVASVRDFRRTLSLDEAEALKWRCDLNITTPKVVVTLATLAYIVLMPVIGFVVCTALYLAGLAYYLGVRKPLPLLLFTGVYTVAVYSIFVAWLRVRLPDGFFV